ncbi:MAG: ABC transporter ATP-binding protein [Candidatus Methylarchaceae archaeon HK01M]|nr:ABC transporter ATP-binding protein [Candidatus Methylarchaceae archaeon HK01M]
MSTESDALIIDSLSKSFGDIKAVRNLSLDVKKGEVHGLLGPNGSGKSTTMKMILGLIRPDAGSIYVNGLNPEKDPTEVRRIVGYVPESPRLYEFLTGIEYLDFIADIHGLDADTKRRRIKEFLEALELEGRENEMISGYSQGMKQKITIIAALLHKPKLLILDEPLSNIDPKSARIIKDLINGLSREGVATIFSTHVLEIAEAICQRLTIMSQGEVLASGTPVQLRELAGMPGSGLEDAFLKLTGTGDIQEIVKALL